MGCASSNSILGSLTVYTMSSSEIDIDDSANDTAVEKMDVGTEFTTTTKEKGKGKGKAAPRKSKVSKPNAEEKKGKKKV